MRGSIQGEGLHCDPPPSYSPVHTVYVYCIYTILYTPPPPPPPAAAARSPHAGRLLPWGGGQGDHFWEARKKNQKKFKFNSIQILHVPGTFFIFIDFLWVFNFFFIFFLGGGGWEVKQKSKKKILFKVAPDPFGGHFGTILVPGRTFQPFYLWNHFWPIFGCFAQSGPKAGFGRPGPAPPGRSTAPGL